jgi:GxxExxY protein
MNHETHEQHEKILFKEECYQIQGAVFDVYREMGSGFLEAVYQECLERELSRRDIPFTAQPELTLQYKGESLRQIYKPDFICFGGVIVELKAIKDVAPEHKAQVLNYLKASGMKLGLLINFGTHPKVSITRLAR